MKKYNFNAGPSILPREVIEATSAACLDFEGSGLSLMETSHRAKNFQPIVDEAVALFKELLSIPEGYSVVFLGGGASLEFCMVPYNFLEKKAAYLNTGVWASKAQKEAKLFGEVVEVAKGYTSSDDQIETRMNLYNEWVTELPTDLSVRSWDGTTEGAAPIIIAKDALSEVSSIEITFDYIYGEPAVAEGPVPMTEEEIAAAQAADYNAYFGFQTENYIFRNAWDDASYGKAVEDGLYFGRMTGWDADNNAVDYGGTYTDAAVTANGTYTVSLTCGDMAYGPDTFFRMLYVSTDIPSAAVDQGVITLSDITVKFGEGKTQSSSYVNTSGDYAKITLIDEYDSKVPAELAYTMPAAGETITISFTVSGLAD